MNKQELDQAEADIARLRACYKQFRSNLATVIVGQNDTLQLLATGLLSGGHMLLIGVPGLAKTLMVRGLGETLGWRFHRIQFTPDLMPGDITGTEILQNDEQGGNRKLVFHRGPIFANLILADEINRTPPKTQAALLEAMQERSVTVNGVTYALDAPFVVIATQNPIEQEGTYPLPEAQLDRFMLSIHLEYPSREEERRIAAQPPRMQIPAMTQVIAADEFQQFIHIVDQVPISPHVLHYAVDLAAATRPKNPTALEFVQRYISWGVGPRCTQHLITTAKAKALLDGRPSPEIEDIQAMALPVMRHRLLLNYHALGEGVEVDALLERLLKQVK